VTFADPDLLERRHELAVVERAVAEANSGRGRLLFLEGPAGIGKSELIRRGRQMAVQAGVRRCTAWGGELESEFPFGVERQLFESRVRELESTRQSAVLAGPARHVAPMLGLPGDVEASDVLPLLHGLYWLTAMTRSTRVSMRSGKAAKSLVARSRTASRPISTSLLPASRMTASSEKTAATASGSWAFQAAYVASFTSRARAR
jgi:AAA ATPase domain